MGGRRLHPHLYPLCPEIQGDQEPQPHQPAREPPLCHQRSQCLDSPVHHWRPPAGPAQHPGCGQNPQQGDRSASPAPTSALQPPEVLIEDEPHGIDFGHGWCLYSKSNKRQSVHAMSTSTFVWLDRCCPSWFTISTHPQEAGTRDFLLRMCQAKSTTIQGRSRTFTRTPQIALVSPELQEQTVRPGRVM